MAKYFNILLAQSKDSVVLPCSEPESDKILCHPVLSKRVTVLCYPLKKVGKSGWQSMINLMSVLV